MPLSPNRVQAGHSQDVPDEGSLFHVSPVSPGFLFLPLRAAQQLPPDGVLLPMTLDDISDSVLGDPITYAQCEQIPGSDSPISLPVYALPSGSAYMPGQSSVQTVLASGTSSHPEVGSSAVAPPMDMEDNPLLETGLPGCPYRFTEYSRQRLACSFITRGLLVFCSTIVPFTNVLGGSAWRRTSNGCCHQPASGRRHYVVQSSDTVTVRHVATPHVVRSDGPGYRPDGVSSGRGR